MADISKITLPNGETYNIKDENCYHIPSTGIPLSDLAQSVQDSLAKAESAITSETQSDWNVTDNTSAAYINNKPTIPPEVTSSTVSGWGFTKNTGTYSKPSGGIPKSDLASSVQTSLGKADTALQSHQSLDSCVKTSGSQTVGGTKTFTSNMLIQSTATKGTAPSSNANRYIRVTDAGGDYLALIQHSYTTSKASQLSILTYSGTTATGTNTVQTRLDFKSDGITCNNDIQASSGKWVYASNGSHYIGLWTPTSDKTDFMQLKSTHGINYMATQPHQFRNGDNSGWAQCKAASFTNQSSIRYKKNVEDITDDEAKKLLYLRPVSYDYKNEIDGINCYGLIAEEVAEIETQPVCFDNDGRPDALDYSKFVPQLIKLCQVQQKEIDDLKSQLNDIKKREG